MILFLIAYILLLPLTIVNYFCVDNKRRYFRSTAVNMDKFGNREFRAMLNKFFRKPTGYKFGDERETISSALGKNQRDGTLTTAGKILCWILDTIDKDHCKKSIYEINSI